MSASGAPGSPGAAKNACSRSHTQRPLDARATGCRPGRLALRCWKAASTSSQSRTTPGACHRKSAAGSPPGRRRQIARSPHGVSPRDAGPALRCECAQLAPSRVAPPPTHVAGTGTANGNRIRPVRHQRPVRRARSSFRAARHRRRRHRRQPGPRPAAACPTLQSATASRTRRSTCSARLRIASPREPCGATARNAPSTAAVSETTYSPGPAASTMGKSWRIDSRLR